MTTALFLTICAALICLGLAFWRIGLAALVSSAYTTDPEVAAEDLLAWAQVQPRAFTTHEAAQALGIPDHSMDLATLQWIKATLSKAGYQQRVVRHGYGTLKAWSPQGEPLHGTRRQAQEPA